MQLLDVNVLIYAHREDSPEHGRYASWLHRLVTNGQPFALSSVTLAGFLRIVTNRRIFPQPTPMGTALAFCHGLLHRRTAVLVQPGPEHFSILADLIEHSGIDGPLVTDAYIAALALEHGCEVVSTDSDFARFGDRVRWRHPLAADN